MARPWSGGGCGEVVAALQFLLNGRAALLGVVGDSCSDAVSYSLVGYKLQTFAASQSSFLTSV